MTAKQKNELAEIEKQIQDMGPYFPPIYKWGQHKKEVLKILLRKRCNLLNEMFECRPKI